MNAYLWRELQSWRRWPGRMPNLAKFTRMDCLLLFVGLSPLICFHLLPVALAVSWLMGVLALPLIRGATAYGEELQRGTAAISLLTVASPWREVWSRYVAAMFTPIVIWLCGPLFIIAPPIYGGQISLNWVSGVLTNWLVMGSFAVLSGALALMLAARGFRTEPSGAISFTVLILLLICHATINSALPLSRYADPTLAEVTVCLICTTLVLRAAVQAVRSDLLIAREQHHDVQRCTWSEWLVFSSTGLRRMNFGSAANRQPDAVLALLPSSIHNNAIFRAFADGLTRRSRQWLPGSLLPAACLCIGLLLEKELGAGAFAGGFLAALMVSAMRGVVRASVSMSTEYSQKTWALLMLAGLTPRDILRGKFAAAFYALSGDWLFSAPVWATLLVTGHVALVLLWLLHPLVIANAILIGLQTQEPERSKPISIVRIVGGLMLGMPFLVGLILLANNWEYIEPYVAAVRSFLNPVTMIAGLAGDMSHAIHALQQLALWLVLTIGMAAASVPATLRSLKRSMS